MDKVEDEHGTTRPKSMWERYSPVLFSILKSILIIFFLSVLSAYLLDPLFPFQDITPYYFRISGHREFPCLRDVSLALLLHWSYLP